MCISTQLCVLYQSSDVMCKNTTYFVVCIKPYLYLYDIIMCRELNKINVPVYSTLRPSSPKMMLSGLVEDVNVLSTQRLV